uniref:Uncharacterized protein n=1 Tax=Pyxicephalus adspersus TaxID=30357 RepID=A0AAV3A3W4_PYXAD|nr:TPA: hypothetical protein GDO54_016465 [Pyxicephalus adspersus]
MEQASRFSIVYKQRAEGGGVKRNPHGRELLGGADTHYCRAILLPCVVRNHKVIQPNSVPQNIKDMKLLNIECKFHSNVEVHLGTKGP